MLTTLPNGQPLTFVADRIQKNWVTGPYHLKVAVMVEIHTQKSPRVTVLHADEVDYEATTGSFTPSGTVTLSVTDRN